MFAALLGNYECKALILALTSVFVITLKAFMWIEMELCT